MRITILGGSGTGKSTLSKNIGKHFHIPVYHIDTIFWKSGWEMNEREDTLQKVNEIIQQEHWVTDGNYVNYHFDQRINQSDLILLLDYNRYVGLYNAVKRYYMYRGKTRDSIADGCIEKIDLEFIKYILIDYPPKKKIMIRRINELQPNKLIRFKNRKQLKLWLQKEGINYEIG